MVLVSLYLDSLLLQEQDILVPTKPLHLILCAPPTPPHLTPLAQQFHVI